MNERQVFCFLVASRTLNFSRAAQELFITQPALSYQIHSLEKELDVELFQRNTAHVELTEAGLAFLGPARQLYRQYLTARNAVKPFVRRNRLMLRLPVVMKLRDPIYNQLLKQLNEACPEVEITISTEPYDREFHHILSTGTDAVISMAPRQCQPEIQQDTLFQTRSFLAISPAHPLHGKAAVQLRELAGQTLFYEQSERTYIDYLRAQMETLSVSVHWNEITAFERCYNNLMAGRGIFVSPMPYEIFPQEWYSPLELEWQLPATCLITLKEDPRPQIQVLREIVCRLYREWNR